MLSPGDIRILVVEDNPGDADLIEAYLEPDARVKARIQRAETLGEALDALASDPGPEIALLDLSLPDSSGIETLDRLREAAPHLPIILLTGSRSGELIWEAVKRGADDYLLKDELTPELLARSVRYTLDRAGAERAIRQREEWFRSLVESVTDLVMTIDPGGRIRYVSPSQAEILEYEDEALRGANVLDLVHPDERAQASRALDRLAAGAESMEFQLRIRTAAGGWRVVEGDARNLTESPAVHGFVITGRDITERVERERLLKRQAEELTERVKEQRCLRQVLSVLHRAADRPRRAFRPVVEAIPGGFQYPETTAARLVVDGEAWETAGFVGTDWSIRCRIDGPDGEAGTLIVVRTALGDDEAAPFIPEERPLLEAIADAVSDALLRAHATAELQRREAYFRSITEHSTDIVAILDETLTPRYVSPSAAEVLGVEVDLAEIEEGVYGLVHPLDQDGLRDLVEELAERPDAIRRSEVRVRVRDEWRTIEFAARNLLEDPDIRGIVVNGRDITERRRTEERFRTLFHTMAQGVVYQDAEGGIISANPAAERILGLTVDQMKGRTSTDRRWRSVRPDGSELPGEEHPAMIALRTGEPVSDVLMGVFHPAEGSTRWIRVDARPQFRPGDTRPYQVYTTFADVTDRVETERALRRKDAILEAVSVASEQLLAAGSLEDVVPGVLESLGRATDVGKVDLWSLGDARGSGAMELSVEHRWTAEDHPAPETGFTRPFGDGLDWLERLRRGESVHVTRTDAPDEARALLEDQGVRSVALIPVLTGDTLWGALRFLDRRRTHGWSEAEVDALGAAGAILGAAVQRRRDEARFREQDQELLRAQKMEAVGRLAGGIAHDFNNLLTAIGGYASFIADNASGTCGVASEVEEIRRAADRGGRLTKQLLAFSRQQVLEERPIEPARTVEELRPLLRRLIGEHIRLSTRVSGDRDPVRMDPAQLEQILMNLVVNARDAVDAGGEIEIAVESVDVGAEARPMLPDVPRPGRYVRLTVRDDGVGMDAATREKVFEPFFTTKDAGKGTGLGLATVYGIVEGADGYIDLISEPGIGTRIAVLLPVTDEPVEAEPEERAAGVRGVASGTVLVVEDEAAVRGVAVRALERSGYTVIAAENGREALETVLDTEASIDVLLTDVVMPEIGGVELARELRRRCPTLKVLLTSGYTQDELVQKGLDDHELAFIPKPYTPAELVGKVAEALGAGATAPE